jgi:hypothetical protein
MKFSMGCSVLLVELLKRVSRSMRGRLPWLPDVLRDVNTRIMSFKRSTGVARMFVRLYQTVVFFQIILRLLTSEALGSITSVLALTRMVGMFFFFFGGALQWTVKTGLLYNTNLRPFKRLSLNGVLVALFVSLILDTDRVLQARKKIRRGARMMRALRESIAETEQTKIELEDALPDEFNTLLRRIRRDPHHATHELISRSLALTTVPEEDNKSIQPMVSLPQQQQQQQQQLYPHEHPGGGQSTVASPPAARRTRLVSGTGLTAGLGLHAKDTLIWRLEVLSDQLRDRLVTQAGSRRQDMQFVKTLLITIVKAVVDGVCALDFVLGWGFSEVLGASLTTLSAGIGMLRLLNRERAKLKDLERLKRGQLVS